MNPISYGATRAAANNERALAQRATAGGISAGQGLSRARGQRAMDAFRDTATRVGANAAADQLFSDDRMANQQMRMQDRAQRDSAALQGRMSADQLQQSRWDNRFGNLTTAWGVLAGLLR